MSLRLRIVLWFVAPLLIAVLVSVVTYRVLEADLQANRLAFQDAQHLQRMGALLRAVIDTENGERGFIITGDENYLTPYKEGQKDFDRVFAELLRESGQQNFSANNPLQRSRVLFAHWLDRSAKPAIAARRQAPVDFVSAALGAYADSLTAQLAAQAWLNRRDGQLRTAFQLTSISVVQRLSHLITELPVNAERGDDWSRALSMASAYAALAERSASRVPADELRRRGMALTDLLHDLSHHAEILSVQAKARIDVETGKSPIVRIRALVTQTLSKQRRQLGHRLAVMERSGEEAKLVTVGGPIFAVILALLLVWALLLEVVRTLRGITRAAIDVADGNLDRRLSVRRLDELGSLSTAFNRMASNLARHEFENQLLDRFGNQLQSCAALSEAFLVAERFAPLLFPDVAGGLYLIAASRDQTERVAAWNDFTGVLSFPPVDCWAIRAGRLHVSGERVELECSHLPSTPAVWRCIPMVAHDEIFGVVVMCATNGAADSRGPKVDKQDISQTFAERLTLSLGNLKLSEALRNQSIRDPLTGLFNRRYLEETLPRELSRAQRQGRSVAVISIDVDHFKHFNDMFGHDAGDAVLKALGQLFVKQVRAEDVACRPGGEEFILIMPDADAALAARRAEDLRLAVKSLDLRYEGETLGVITLSLGVAVWPQDGEDPGVLLKSADRALYKAKEAGRDRVITASATTERSS